MLEIAGGILLAVIVLMTVDIWGPAFAWLLKAALIAGAIMTLLAFMAMFFLAIGG